MIQDFFPLAVVIIVISLLVFFVLVWSRILGPFRPTSRKLMPYESGMDPIGPARRRIPVRFYLVAVSFIVFDVESIFLIPWAVAAKSFAAAGVGMEVFGLVAFFIIVLGVGLAYEWRKGGLDWDR